jgi:hypothetical protein
VLGLFDNWECCVAEVQLAPGDTLVLYTDGVTEATSAEGEEFGEFRFLATLNTHCHLPAATLLRQIIADVQQFSGREQGDDITRRSAMPCVGLLLSLRLRKACRFSTRQMRFDSSFCCKHLEHIYIEGFPHTATSLSIHRRSAA